jgi:hypothetical protein
VVDDSFSDAIHNSNYYVFHKHYCPRFVILHPGFAQNERVGLTFSVDVVMVVVAHSWVHCLFAFVFGLEVLENSVPGLRLVEGRIDLIVLLVLENIERQQVAQVRYRLEE